MLLAKSDLTRKNVLISIRPDYADEIIKGTKTVELRRRFSSNVVEGSLMVIYSTSPTRALVGFARIKAVKRLPVAEIWRQFGKAARIVKSKFKEYFRGLDEGFAIILGEVTSFATPVPAKTLQSKFGFVAPQSFMYLREEYHSLLGNGRNKNTDRHKRVHRAGGS